MSGSRSKTDADVPVVILAGGRGTRLSEETTVRPKPMVEVGGRPIIWHIMKTYDHFGFRQFVLPVGYLGDVVKAYFASYADRHADFTVNTSSGDLRRHDHSSESWDVTVIDTGLDTMTANVGSSTLTPTTMSFAQVPGLAAFNVN